jgi:hypothetical protein
VLSKTFSSLQLNEDWGIDQRRPEPTQSTCDGRVLVVPEFGCIEDDDLRKTPTACTNIDLERCVQFQEPTISRSQVRVRYLVMLGGDTTGQYNHWGVIIVHLDAVFGVRCCDAGEQQSYKKSFHGAFLAVFLSFSLLQKHPILCICVGNTFGLTIETRTALCRCAEIEGRSVAGYVPTISSTSIEGYLMGLSPPLKPMLVFIDLSQVRFEP